MTTCSKPLLWGIPFPGVDEDIATTMAAEMGIRTEQFADGPHLASWTAMCPGNHESAGKRKSGKTRKGNRWLRGALTQAAWAASHTKGTYLSGLFRRISARRGAKRAIVAVGHSILISAFYMWQNKQPYQELGDACSGQDQTRKNGKSPLREARQTRLCSYSNASSHSQGGVESPELYFRESPLLGGRGSIARVIQGGHLTTFRRDF